MTAVTHRDTESDTDKPPIDKAIEDALIYGQGVMFGGQYLPYPELFKSALPKASNPWVNGAYERVGGD